MVMMTWRYKAGLITSIGKFNDHKRFYDFKVLDSMRDLFILRYNLSTGENKNPVGELKILGTGSEIVDRVKLMYLDQITFIFHIKIEISHGPDCNSGILIRNPKGYLVKSRIWWKSESGTSLVESMFTQEIWRSEDKFSDLRRKIWWS